jgi:hypothetical protein
MLMGLGLSALLWAAIGVVFKFPIELIRIFYAAGLLFTALAFVICRKC